MTRNGCSWKPPPSSRATMVRTSSRTAGAGPRDRACATLVRPRPSPVRAVPAAGAKEAAMVEEATTSRTALVRRARRINRELARLYPDARTELNFASPLELLVAAILSAQTTDRKVNEVTRVLFARYRTAADYAAADQAELEKVIAPTGYFRAKAKTLIALGHALSDRFGGEVPDTLEELVTLPGVGRKTGQPGARRCVREAGHRGRYPFRLAGAAVRVDRAHRPGQDRARRRRAAAPAGVDRGVPPGDPARSPGLSRPQARLRRVRSGPVVPVVRHGPDRRGDRDG